MGLNKTIMEICDIIKNDLIDLEEPIVPIFAYSVKNVYKFIDRFKSKENETIISAPIEIGHVIGTHIGPGGFGVVYVKKDYD